MVSPVDIVQRQLDAYNDHDLERFLANFSDTIKVFRMPTLEPSLVGKAQLSDFYATQRFNRPALRAQLLSRIVCGNKVIDHERIWGMGEHAIETVGVFEVVDGLIQTSWFFAAG
ncbi:steroid delta-isomerase [Cystobacter fuscus]|uniref:nuclear transport factor 2 family protein n=1 Tax=Cystobacter fuscus TaxID=43 RepID=UPI002B2D672A|nr:steroid delta-isomerase [Cystobacter fuscus]